MQLMSSLESQNVSIVDSIGKICTGLTSHVSEIIIAELREKCHSTDQWQKALQNKSAVEVNLERFSVEELPNPACIEQAFIEGPYGAQVKGQEVLTSLEYIKNCRLFQQTASHGGFDDTLVTKVIFSVMAFINCS